MAESEKTLVEPWMLCMGAAVLTPLALFASVWLISLISFGGGSADMGELVPYIAALFFVLGICLWRRIRPIFYTSLLPLSCPVVLCVFADRTTTHGPFFGVLVIFAFFVGLLIGLLACIIAIVARRWRYPDWLSQAMVVLAMLTLLADQITAAVKARRDTVEIRAVLHQMISAEEVYAAMSPQQGYTCNGPELSKLAGIKWEVQKNQPQWGTVNEYNVNLECDWKMPAKWFVLTARSQHGGNSLEFDSRRTRLPGMEFGAPED